MSTSKSGVRKSPSSGGWDRDVWRWRPWGRNMQLRLELGSTHALSSYYNYHSFILRGLGLDWLRWPNPEQCCVCLLCCCTLVFGSARSYVSTPLRPRLSLQPWALMRPDSLFTLDAISLTFLHGLALTTSWRLTALLNQLCSYKGRDRKREERTQRKKEENEEKKSVKERSEGYGAIKKPST